MLVSLALVGVSAAVHAPPVAGGDLPTDLKSTIVVSPVGSPAANGQALIAAARDAQPSEQNRLQIWIEPGIYDVGNESLVLKPFLSLRGSGRESTLIRGNAQGSDAFLIGKGIVHGADYSSIKFLTIGCQSDESQRQGGCIHLVNYEASPIISHIRIESEGYGSQWGIRNVASSPQIEDIEISLRGGLNNYGIVNSLDARPTIRRSNISASGGNSFNSGIFNRDGGLPLVIDDVEVFAAEGSEAYAVYNFEITSLARMEVVDSLLVAREAQDNGAVRAGTILLDAQGSTFEADSPGSTVRLSQYAEIDIRDSEMMGSGLLAYGRNVRLGSVRISGDGQVGAANSLACAAVFSLGETARFFQDECPAGTNKRLPVKARNLRDAHVWSELAH